MDALTKTQQRIYDFIHGELTMGQPAPTAREVAARFKYRSYRAAEDHIAALIRKGWLASTPGKARQ
jgi:repressor LexA